jgi:hypothetical protein
VASREESYRYHFVPQHRCAQDLPARLLSVEAGSADGLRGPGISPERTVRSIAPKIAAGRFTEPAQNERVTDAVQQGQLRPHRIPAPRRRWHGRLIPVTAATTVIAIAVVVALLTGMPSGQNPAPTSTQVPAAMPADQNPALTSAQLPDGVPPYYLTLTLVRGSQPVMQAEGVVRASASGRVTGTVKVPTPLAVPVLNAAAAPDDRSFIIGAHGFDSAGWPDYRLFRLRISASGKPGQLTELPYLARYQNLGVSGFALSPDGKLLAVSMQVSPFKAPNAVLSETIDEIEVINLGTGQVRTWTAPPQGGHYYMSGPPSWADGDRMIAFTWQRSPVGFGNWVMEGVRLLDTEAPGGNLMDSGWIVPGKTVDGTIQGALITPDGRDVIMATSRNIASGASTGTVVVRIVAVAVASGRLVRVLRTQTARYNVRTMYGLDGSGAVLSLDPTGRYALVQCIQFGWMDIGGREPGRFAPLPGEPDFGAAW